MTTRSGESERGFTLEDPSGEARQDPGLPKIDFSTFVLSLATSALYHMGLASDPETGSPPKPNLTLARQTIDTLAMLEEKTQGNLDAEESKLLGGVLYELRMGFVKVEGK